MTASPTNFSTTPPKDSISRRTVSWYGVRIARTSSGSSCSARAVKPTRSTNMTLMNRRSSCGAASSAPSAAPHARQNRATSGFSWPHVAQTCTGKDYDGEPTAPFPEGSPLLRTGPYAWHQRRARCGHCKAVTDATIRLSRLAPGHGPTGRPGLRPDRSLVPGTRKRPEGTGPSADLLAHQRHDALDLAREVAELGARDLLRGIGERLLGPGMRLDDDPVGADR